MSGQELRQKEIEELRILLGAADAQLIALWKQGNRDPRLTEKCCELGERLRGAEKMYQCLYGKKA